MQTTKKNANKRFRVRYQINSAAPMNYQVESQKLIEQIKQYNVD